MFQVGNSTQTEIFKSRNIISDELLEIFHTINLAIVSAVVAVFGIVSNILNIIIFIKLGLNDTANISLLAMAVSDFSALITLEWMCLIKNPLFINNVPLVAIDVVHLTAAWPHACFARITSWITVYITLERFLCVVIPLKIKRVITPKVTTSVIISIYLIMFLSLAPEYSTCYIDWRFVPKQNRSMLGLVFLSGRDQVAALSFMFATGTQLSSSGALVVLTVILVIKVQEKSKWRKSTSSYGNNPSTDTIRDKRIVKMIIIVAIIYCVCFLPLAAIYLAVCIEPEFIVFGLYNNSFLLSCSFTFVLDCINSSVNIFVYYRMSSKYRTMFDSLILRKPKLLGDE